MTNDSPKLHGILTAEEYKQYEYYKQKMMEANTKAEMDYYYNQAKILIKEAKNK